MFSLKNNIPMQEAALKASNEWGSTRDSFRANLRIVVVFSLKGSNSLVTQEVSLKYTGES